MLDAYVGCLCWMPMLDAYVGCVTLPRCFASSKDFTGDSSPCKIHELAISMKIRRMNYR